MSKGVGILGFTVLLVAIAAGAVYLSGGFSGSNPKFQLGDAVWVLPGVQGTVVGREALPCEHGLDNWQYTIRLAGDECRPFNESAVYPSLAALQQCVRPHGTR